MQRRGPTQSVGARHRGPTQSAGARHRAPARARHTLVSKQKNLNKTMQRLNAKIGLVGIKHACNIFEEELNVALEPCHPPMGSQLRAHSIQPTAPSSELCHLRTGSQHAHPSSRRGVVGCLSQNTSSIQMRIKLVGSTSLPVLTSKRGTYRKPAPPLPRLCGLNESLGLQPRTSVKRCSTFFSQATRATKFTLSLLAYTYIYIYG